MSIANWMILAAILLPYFTIIPARGKDSDYDNTAPRRWTGAQEGWRARAHWAHLNHFETFPPFAAGVIIAEMRHANQLWIDILAVAFVALRIAYTVFYVRNQDKPRSLVFVLGLLLTTAYFFMAGLAKG